MPQDRHCVCVVFGARKGEVNFGQILELVAEELLQQAAVAFQDPTPVFPGLKRDSKLGSGTQRGHLVEPVLLVPQKCSSLATICADHGHRAVLLVPGAVPDSGDRLQGATRELKKEGNHSFHLGPGYVGGGGDRECPDAPDGTYDDIQIKLFAYFKKYYSYSNYHSSFCFYYSISYIFNTCFMIYIVHGNEVRSPGSPLDQENILIYDIHLLMLANAFS